ncbi:Sugar transferase involved in LPS biosynthesis (colanic, teichoic acid) [Beijerinckia sp. 28-YEA-48]|nr:Sugar transferase involved in LPS biosynthesis (colanic, teichoic acid) [Beijerinckia sp. 28-YEA-48]
MRTGPAAGGYPDKRLLDIAAAGIGLVMLLPVLALVAVAIKLDSPGPAFFLQTRVGRGGRPFRIVKFRSMHCRQDPALPRLTVAGDPRVTRVGSFIRRTKLDELPQLFNVLFGSMSLVGPRPEVEEFLEFYPAEQRVSLLSMRPGVTDLASILLRDESAILAASPDPTRTYRESLLPLKAALSEQYRKQMSLSLDIRILLATVYAIFAGKPPVWLRELSSPLVSDHVRPSSTSGNTQAEVLALGEGLSAPSSDGGLKHILRPIARNAFILSSLTALGQLSFLIALPFLTRMFRPSELGTFTIYLSVVNICGPLVALKFESALYAAEKRDDARQIFVLCALAILGMTTLAWGIIKLIGYQFPALPAVLSLVPLGIFFAGFWSLTSAWAIRFDAIPTLSVARFLQPACMTVLQIAAGMTGFHAEGLILAHIASHALYTSFIMTRTLSLAELRELWPLPWRAILRRALDNRQFALFTMPAHVSSLAVSNLPPLVIGAMFSSAAAGYVGVAYRIAAAPLAIISLPLGHILTSEAVRDHSFRRIRMLTALTVAASFVFVSLPLLLLAGLAPRLAPILFDADWSVTGDILSALAIFAASQALLIPLVELTSVYKKQTRRLIVELTTLFLVFSSLLLGPTLGWTALPTIWAMSLCGTVGTLIGVVVILASVLRRPADGRETDDDMRAVPASASNRTAMAVDLGCHVGTNSRSSTAQSDDDSARARQLETSSTWVGERTKRDRSPSSSVFCDASLADRSMKQVRLKISKALNLSVTERGKDLP